MHIQCLNRNDHHFPEGLKKLHQPVENLYIRGNVKTLEYPMLAVVGSRAASAYGKEVTLRLVSEVAWQKNLVIVSGLALGIDSLAHHATLKAQGNTVAVLPGGIENIYPAAHQRLAEQIVEHGGAIISEHPGVMRPRKYHFIARNRIIAGLSQAVLITEATQRSGSLHTAQFALEDGKEVLAVPGDIFRPSSVGTNTLIANGAIPIRTSQDILNLFNNSAHIERGDNAQEEILLRLIRNGIRRQDQLLYKSGLAFHTVSQTLGMLEIKGKVKNNGHAQWSPT